MHDMRCLLCLFSCLLLLGGRRRRQRTRSGVINRACYPFLRCMAGTNQKQPHCKALIGTPGENVSCAIYENRPSTCREFSISGEGGEVNEACNRARARYGLPPLYKDMLFHTTADAATVELSRYNCPQINTCKTQGECMSITAKSVYRDAGNFSEINLLLSCWFRCCAHLSRWS